MKLFKKYQLNLGIKCNLKTVDYLDISFNLNTGIYKPFNKLNNKPLYINASSNHRPSVLKQIPKLYQKGLPLTLTMKIFSGKVLRFTIQS